MINCEKTVNPNGSFSTLITDSETNRVEIQTYDVEGACIERVYGFMSDEPILSAEDIDNYISELLEKERLSHTKE